MVPAPPMGPPPSCSARDAPCAPSTCLTRGRACGLDVRAVLHGEDGEGQVFGVAPRVQRAHTGMSEGEWDSGRGGGQWSSRSGQSTLGTSGAIPRAIRSLVPRTVRLPGRPAHLGATAGGRAEACVHDNRVQLVAGWSIFLQKNVTGFLSLMTIYPSAFSNQKRIKNCKNYDQNTGEQVLRVSVNERRGISSES